MPSSLFSLPMVFLLLGNSLLLSLGVGDATLDCSSKPIGLGQPLLLHKTYMKYLYLATYIKSHYHIPVTLKPVLHNNNYFQNNVRMPFSFICARFSSAIECTIEYTYVNQVQ